MTIQDAISGGGFFIETSSSPAIWDEHPGEGPHPGYAPGMRFTRIAPHDKISRGDEYTHWIHAVTGARWTTPASTGTAVAYGARLIYGTTPVAQGRCRKFITASPPTPDPRTSQSRSRAAIGPKTGTLSGSVAGQS
ncbi:hypothetical protein [Streptomyces erythrochromogenes]|uniref:hypothetical protein n=1 Tax=Streptomyces erythrochromogenes TaxID=285574 RepID=UPI003814CB43